MTLIKIFDLYVNLYAVICFRDLFIVISYNNVVFDLSKHDMVKY